MANVLTTEILESGDRNAVVKIVGQVDSADITYDVTINPAFYPPNLGQLRIDSVHYSVEPGLTVNLWWDAAVPAIAQSLDGAGKFNAAHFGGLQNNATDPTGAIALSTEGWDTGLTFGFTLLMHLVKQSNSVAATAGDFLLQEGGDFILQENGDKIELG